MGEEKKIIIDEDWKTQVAAEKAATQRTSHESAATGSGAGEDVGAAPPLEASFELLVTTFVTEAMVALGQMPHPASNELVFDAAHARFAIDMLEVIAEKTNGNLAPEEDQGLTDLLHQLRMAFVAISKQVDEQATGATSGGIELP